MNHGCIADSDISADHEKTIYALLGVCAPVAGLEGLFHRLAKLLPLQQIDLVLWRDRQVLSTANSAWVNYSITSG